MEIDSKENKVQNILNKSVGKVKDKSTGSSNITASSLNISEITPNLYLCSATSVHTSTLEILDIRCVINATTELPDTPLPGNTTAYYRVNVQDSSNENIKDYFDTVADLIHEVEDLSGKTLVHCVAGVSRSASLCIAYLMKYFRFTLLEAYDYIKLKRPIIRPNCNFFRQLIEYEKELFGSNTISMVFNDTLNLEVPDVYDSEYREPIYFRRKCGENGKFKTGTKCISAR